MNRLDLEEIINKAAKEAVKEFNKEKLIEQRKKVFHNTRLLMKNYNKLKEHVEKAIGDVNKLKEHETYDIRNTDYVDITREMDELYILSIMQSKTKTLIMLAHIDTCMAILKQRQIEAGTIEKYEAFKMFYIDRKSHEEIQEKFSCGKNTPGRWIDQMTNELSVYLFGVDGLKLDMVK